MIKEIYIKVLVCGGRSYGDLESLNGDKQHPQWPQLEKEYRHVLDTLTKLSLDWPKLPEDEYGNWLPNVTIIQGNSSGVDNVAIDWAVINWTGLEGYTAGWKTYGRMAGPMRNREMLEKGKPDLVVAFPGGKGTANMIKIAKQAGVPVIIVEPIT